jgi:hypothetical protein
MYNGEATLATAAVSRTTVQFVLQKLNLLVNCAFFQLTCRVEAATSEGDRASVAKELSPVQSQSQSPQQHAHLFADPNASGDAVKTIGISSHRHNSSSVHSPSSQQQQLSPQAAAAVAPPSASAAVADNSNSNSSDDAPSASEPGSAAVGASTDANSAGAAGAAAAVDGEKTGATTAAAATGSDSISDSSGSSSSSKAVKGSLWIRAKTGPLKGQVTSTH